MDLIYELILGYHPKFEKLFYNVLQKIRSNLNLKVKDINLLPDQEKINSCFNFILLNEKKSDNGVSDDMHVEFNEVNVLLVKKIFNSTM
jgi:hypothetical protein